MHVISEKKLREFWGEYPDAEHPLRAWRKVAESSAWETITDVRKVYPHADIYDRCVIFNIGGNKYRLITSIHYNRNKVFIRDVLTHSEYDLEKWKEGCKCKRQQKRTWYS